jgi:hypothetical protein
LTLCAACDLRFTVTAVGIRSKINDCHSWQSWLCLISCALYAKGGVSRELLWGGHDRGAAVAKMVRLEGVLEPPSFRSHRSGEHVATNIDVERMVASFVITTPAKKKPRH